MKRLRDLVPWKSAEKVPVTRELSPFNALQREMNRMFDDFFSGWGVEPFRGLGTLGEKFGGFSPTVNIEETETEIRVRAELAGLDEKDVKITLKEDYLVLAGEKREEEKREDSKRHYRESFYGAFERVIPLDAEIEADRVSATLKKGVLEIVLPKTAQAQKAERKVSVRVEEG